MHNCKIILKQTLCVVKHCYLYLLIFEFVCFPEEGSTRLKRWSEENIV